MLTWKEEHKVQLFLAFPHSASDLGLKVKFQGLRAGHPQSLSSHASAGGGIPSSGLGTDDLTVPKGKKKVNECDPVLFHVCVNYLIAFVDEPNVRHPITESRKLACLSRQELGVVLLNFHQAHNIN